MKDWRGTPISVGSKVVYPGRCGSYLYMVEAEVVEVSTREVIWTKATKPILKVRRLRECGGDVEPKMVTISEPSRVTVVT